MSFDAVLLCGGHSTRMGRDKAFIDWLGRPLWQVQLEKLKQLSPRRLFISCRREQNISHPDAECLFDPVDTDDGPLGAIARTLQHSQIRLLVLAVDMPWMTTDCLREKILPGGFYHGEHGFEALCAVYEPEMLPSLQTALSNKELALQRVIANSSPLVHKLSGEEIPFFRNANTQADFSNS